MNALYHIAIIEGFLAQHQQLPRNVQEAVEFLKRANAEKPAEAPAQKKKRKPKMSPETQQKLLAALAKGRATHAANLAARKAA